MDINAGLRPSSSHKVISDIYCLQGGGRVLVVLEEVVLQELGLAGTWLILTEL